MVEKDKNLKRLTAKELDSKFDKGEEDILDYFKIVKNDRLPAPKLNSQILVASPLEIDDTDFGYSDLDFNHKEYQKYRKQVCHLIHEFPNGFGLYKVADHFLVFDDEKQRILYCVKYAIISFLKYRFVVQKKIWRSAVLTNAFSIEGMNVPAYVFFKQLLPLADGVGIVTDAMQTASGKRFWFDRVAQAFEKSFNVYLMDRTKKTKVQLKDFDDFEATIKKEKTWSPDDYHSLNRRIVISKNRLL